MLATVTLLQAAGLRWPWALVLLVAAVVVTVFDPWVLTQPGFWLSFMAVGLLMASSAATTLAPDAATGAASGWRAWPARFVAAARGGLRTQAIATLGLTPLTLVFFQQVSLVGFIANLVAIPVVTLVITPLALAGVALAALVARRAGRAGARRAAGSPRRLAGRRLDGRGGSGVGAANRPARGRAGGRAAAVACQAPRDSARPRVARSTPVVAADGAFDVVAADVGQGTAVLVRTRGHALLFDSGPQYSRESDAGQRVLVPLLRSRGERRLDLLVLSHRDSDHVGGARTLLGAIEVDALSSSLEDGHPLLGAAREQRRCSAGQHWRWDGVEFTVLHPAAEDYARPLRPNAMSCVLRVASAGRSVLLTGDIEREPEAALVAAHGDSLRSDVLIVPHHGSKTSSSAPFLDAVRPRIAIFQAGYRNRFGHPAAEVLERYRERGIAVVASPACGAWQWHGDGAAAGACERDVARRYRHHRSEPSPH